MKSTIGLLLLFLFVGIESSALRRNAKLKSNIRRQGVRTTSCCCNVQVKITTCCTYYYYQPTYRVVLTNFNYYPCQSTSNTMQCGNDTPLNPVTSQTTQMTQFPSLYTVAPTNLTPGTQQTPFQTINTVTAATSVLQHNDHSDEDVSGEHDDDSSEENQISSPTQPTTGMPVIQPVTYPGQFVTDQPIVVPDPGQPIFTGQPGVYPVTQPTTFPTSPQPGVFPVTPTIMDSGKLTRPDCAYLSEDGKYALSWEFLPANQQVRFSLSTDAPVGQNSFWSGVGFGTGMSDADMNLVIVQNGQVTISDRTSTGYTAPSADVQQDVIQVSGSLVNGQLSASWIRPLTNVDQNDKDLATCQTFLLPVVPGPVNDEGEVSKHSVTPLTQLVCNIQNCAAGNKMRSKMVDQKINIDPPKDLSSKCQFKLRDYHLAWTYNPLSKDVTFYLNTELSYNGYMWTGVGFGRPKGFSDYVVVMSINGQLLVTDRHAKDDQLPKLDYQTQVRKLKGQIDGKKLKVVFRRPLVPADQEDLPLDDPNIRNGCQYFMFPVQGAPADFGKIKKPKRPHEQRLVCHIKQCIPESQKWKQEQEMRNVWYLAKRHRSP